MKIEFPIGKKNGITKNEIKNKYNISEEDFYKLLEEERTKRIIIIDKTYGKYYLPSTTKEYHDFIQKNSDKLYHTQNMIDLAYYELGYRSANNELE